MGEQVSHFESDRGQKGNPNSTISQPTTIFWVPQTDLSSGRAIHEGSSSLTVSVPINAPVEGSGREDVPLST